MINCLNTNKQGVEMKINFKITKYCPARCICCEERLRNFEKMEEKSEKLEILFDEILGIFKRYGDEENHLSITGGEPTLIDGLDQYVAKMTEHNISVGIDTNGWNVTEQWIESMEKAGLKYILFSVYSLNKRVYDYLRGASNSELFLRMERAFEALKNYKSSNDKIEVRLQTLLMKNNYKELPKLLQKAISSKFNTISTSYYISVKPQKTILMNKFDIQIFKNDISKQLLDIMKKSDISSENLIINQKKIKSFFQFDDINLDDIEKGIYRAKEENCKEKNKFIIYPNGNLVPCVGFDYCMDSKYTTNIFKDKRVEENLDEIFEEFWGESHDICTRCANGKQIWLNLK